MKAKLVDPQGNVVPIGKPGELLVAGYPLQKGYWNDEAHTQQVMRRDEEGTLWMHTGDEGIMDEEGYLKSKRQIYFRDRTKQQCTHRCPTPVVGRIKDIIIRGGEVGSVALPDVRND